MKLFIDTWGWLTLEDRKAPLHAQAAKHYRRRREESWRFITTDYVLDELITRLFQRRPYLEAKRFVDGLLEAAERDYLRIEPIGAHRFREAWLARLRYDDQPALSFTDLTSFVVMRELAIREVLTEDRHFRLAGFETVP